MSGACQQETRVSVVILSLDLGLRLVAEHSVLGGQAEVRHLHPRVTASL